MHGEAKEAVVSEEDGVREGESGSASESSRRNRNVMGVIPVFPALSVATQRLEIDITHTHTHATSGDASDTTVSSHRILATTAIVGLRRLTATFLQI